MTFSTFTRHSLATLLVSTVLGATSALAQTVVGPADASRVNEGTKAPKLMAAPETKVEVKRAPSVQAPAGADKMSLTLNDIVIEGSTVYAPSELRALYADRLGQKVSLADVYAIANAMTVKYRNDGYVLTQVVVPPQTIAGGNVRLQVVEGFIDNITVGGAISESERGLIAAYAERARGAGPLNVRDLEQAVLLINDLAGVSARSILSPSPSKVGGADLQIIIDRKPFDALVGLDNFGSRYLGQYEITGAVYGNSLLGLNERLGLQTIYAPGSDMDKELLYGDVSYSQPFGSWGTRLDVLASIASTDPGYTLKEFDINGRSVFWNARLNQPIIRTRNLNWNVYGLFDFRNTDTDSNIEPTRTDHIRAARAGTDVSFLDTIFGAGYNTLSIELARGLDVMDASDKGDANLSREFGNPQFTKLDIEYQRLQRVTDNVNLLFGAKGQMASGALLSAEEFGVGGAQYGRGYDPSEIVGDDGIAGKLELQVNDPWRWSLVDTYQLYGFVDAGRVWNTDATTSADKKISLASTGLGLRATFPAQTQAGFYVALPLNRDVQSQGDQDARIYFSLAQPF